MSVSFELIEKALENQLHVFKPCTRRGEAKLLTDTRNLQEKEIFLALSGETFNGTDFIPQALEKKISLIIASKGRFFEKNFDKLNYGDAGVFLVDDTIYAYGEIAKAYLQQFRGIKIVITGSAGKTTVKDLLSQLLSLKYKVFSSEKNYNNQIGVPQNILSIKNDVDYFVFEIGTNHKGEIARLSEIIQADIGIITNVLNAHVGMFESKEALIEEKFSLINSMKKGEVFVLEDLEALNRLEQRIDESSLNLKKINPEDVRLISFEEGGEIKTHVYQNEKKLTEIPCTSSQNGKNLSLALSVAKFLGVPYETMIASLKDLQFPRFALKNFSTVTLIDDAYNANLDSMLENIDWLINLETKRKKIFVLGDVRELGDKEKTMHVQFGATLRKKYVQFKNVEFCFIGPLMRHAFKSSSLPSRTYFLRAEEAAIFFREYLEKDAVYYLKASKAMKFYLISREIESVLSHPL